MKYLAMIQARCGSTRLPNKVLKDLCGKPALQRMIERVQKSKYVDEVMVVTSIERNNLPILHLCSELDVRVGIGSEDDVLDRFYQTAKLLSPEYVIRLTADCPCFDAELLDLAIEGMKPETDFCSNANKEQFADGLDFEILTFCSLEKSWKEAVHSFEREHVTQYILRRPDVFVIQDYESPIGYFGNHRWTIDEPEDYELVKCIYEYFCKECNLDDFGYKEILEYLDKNPDLLSVNSQFSRNEGLMKSIKEDKLMN